MIVIPAIDLKDGKCVRLVQGKKEAVTIYSDDPVSTARHWAALGAKLLHVVDLDGAFDGIQKNLDVIIAIRRAVDIGIEIGGGIRDMDRIDALLNAGLDRVVLGTAVVEKQELVEKACKKFPGRILIGIDAKDGWVAVRGWQEVTDIKAVSLAEDMMDKGVAGIIYTDISRDGMLSGPNLDAVQEMVNAVNLPVIASGGIKTIDDIRTLMGVKGLWGAITGKAIYSGSLDLKKAIELTSEISPSS